MNQPQAIPGDRSLFPDLEARAYMNHAAISPVAMPVRRAVEEALADYARRGLDAWGTWRERRDQLRERLAGLLGVAASDLGFTANTSQAVLAAALCFPWEDGDRIVTFCGEFPANVTPWQQAARRFGLALDLLSLEPFQRSTGEGLAALEAQLRRGVRLVAVSAVQFQNGLRMPVEEMAELCHRHGTQLFVDGIQAAGAVPLDLSRIDYMAGGSHKWLMGIEGVGYLYVHPDRIGSLRPLMAGWLSHEDAAGFLFEGPGHLRYDRPIRRRADFLEGGAANVVGCAALDASVALLAGLGVQRIADHVAEILDDLEAGLLQRGFHSLRSPDPARRSGILGVLPPRKLDVVALRRGLAERGISCTIPDGVLRFAPHWPNRREEVPVILEALDEATAELNGH